MLCIHDTMEHTWGHIDPTGTQWTIKFLVFLGLKTYDQQFTLTTKKSLHIIFNINDRPTHQRVRWRLFALTDWSPRLIQAEFSHPASHREGDLYCSWSPSSSLCFLAGLLLLFWPYPSLPPAWKRYMSWSHLPSAVRLLLTTTRLLTDKSQPTRQQSSTTWTCWQHCNVRVFYWSCQFARSAVLCVYVTAAVDKTTTDFLVMTGVISLVAWLFSH